MTGRRVTESSEWSETNHLHDKKAGEKKDAVCSVLAIATKGDYGIITMFSG
jgi:hypothetical protein